VSTIPDIVTATAELVGKVEELLKTETARAAPELAVELKAQVQFNQAIDVLSKLLQGIKTGLEALREPLVHVGALAGLIGLLDPFLETFRDLVKNVQGDLSVLGLQGSTEVFQPVVLVVDRGDMVVDAGKSLLDQVAPLDQIDKLLTGLLNLDKTLNDLKAKP